VILPGTDWDFDEEGAVPAAEVAAPAFPMALIPHEDESLLSVVARAGAANGRDRLVQVCSLAGTAIPYATYLPFATFERTALASLLGIGVGEIERRLYRLCSDPQRVMQAGVLHGVEVRRKHLSTQVRRVSPASLRNTLHHRAMWDLKPIPCCLSGQDLLMHRCPGCGHAITWKSTALHLCGHAECRADLRDANTDAVDADMLRSVRVIADLYSHDDAERMDARNRLPADFRSLPASDLMDLAIFFGVCAGDPAGSTVAARRSSLASGNYSDWTTADLAAGADLIADWPRSFARLADLVLEAAGKRPGRFGLRKFFGPLVEVVDPNRFADGTVRAAERTLSDVIANRPGVVLRPDENKRFRPGHTGITLSAAAEEHGIGIEHLARMVRRPGFILAGSGGKGMPVVLDAAKVEAAVASYRDMIEPEVVRTRYGLDAVTVERLVSAGQLIRADGPERDLRLKQVDYLRRSSVEALVGRLEAKSREMAECGTTLAMALLPANGRPEARAEVLLAILDGRLTLLRVERSRKRFGYRLIVDRSEVHALVLGGTGRRQETVTLQLAAELLGLNWEVTRELCQRTGIPLVRVGSSNRLAMRDVTRLKSTYVSGGEVAHRIGTIARHLHRYLRPLGIEPALVLRTRGQRLYDRAVVEADAAHLLQSGSRRRNPGVCAMHASPDSSDDP